MKITRGQLRRLIQESFFSPEAAMAAAKERIDPVKRQKAMKLVQANNPFSVEQGYELLDAASGYASPYDGSRETAKIYQEEPDNFVDDVVEQALSSVGLDEKKRKEIREDMKTQLIDIIGSEYSFGMGYDISAHDPHDEIDTYFLDNYKSEIELRGGISDVIENTAAYKDYASKFTLDWKNKRADQIRYDRPGLLTNILIPAAEGEIDAIGEGILDELLDDGIITTLDDGRFLAVASNFS